MIYEFQDYRAYLRADLVERTRRNISFSLRAYARLLKLQPSLLSEVLSGKRNLSETAALEIAERLGLKSEALIYFRALVAYGRAKSPSAKKAALDHVNQLRPQRVAMQDLSVDAFLAISDWYPMALSKALDIPGFRPDSEVLARALGLSRVEVEAAWDRLERLELIERKPDGSIVKCGKNYLIQSPVKSEALRKYHVQMLEKTASSLEEQAPDQRYTGTENILLRPEQLPRAAEIFEECFQKILALSDSEKTPESEVYHLGIHCIPLSRFQQAANKHQKLRKNT